MPSVAIAELKRDADRVFDILRFRSWHAAKEAYDDLSTLDAKRRQAVLRDPTVQLIRELDFEEAQRSLDESTADDKRGHDQPAGGD